MAMVVQVCTRRVDDEEDCCNALSASDAKSSCGERENGHNRSGELL
jgi:hypothetical protein